jgi:phage shock protein PspC (stress-responsive transcriptional regulator)
MEDTNITPANDTGADTDTPESTGIAATPGSDVPSDVPTAAAPSGHDPVEPFDATAAGPPPVPPAAHGDRWTRPRTGRILAGVAAGVAQRTELPLWFVRATFVVTAIAGGFGLAAYLAAWALMPQEGEHRAAADGWKERFDQADSPSKKLGLGLVALGVVIAVGTTGILSSPLAVAAVLVVAGLALTRPSPDHH